MQIKELKKQLELNPQIQVGIINHTASSFCLVQIRNAEEVKFLTGWRGQHRVFRSLDEATEELARHGIKPAFLTNYEPFYEGLNTRPLSFSF
ncbi:hypothetical protein [Marinospirillum minutulum]|uniref:hypothetical protein n=1 Tax=Marinospirillum minutulum TaxID=64974 RepID=UPI0003F59BF4|nr:hypothetical protein [Marinospirillum minutulum]